MDTLSNTLPNQHNSIKEKKDPNWYRPTYDYLIAKATNQKNSDKLKEWLDAANGIISNSTIQYAISPLISEEGENFEYPGEIRETDLINSVREQNMGEYIELPYRFSVMVNNADAIEKRDIEVSKELTKLAQSSFVTMLKQIQQKRDIQKQQLLQKQQQDGNTSENIVQPEMEDNDIPNFENFAKEFKNNWLDERAIQGQHILELINNTNNFDIKRLQAFFYWWATEEFYTYRQIINNEIYTSIINPLEGFPLSNSELFVEDYDGFIIKKMITWEECYAKYKDKIPKSQEDYFNSIVDKSKSGSAISVNPVLLNSQWLSSDLKSNIQNKIDSQADVFLTDNSKTLEESTIIWRTERPIKYVTRDVPLIGIEEEIVDDAYILNEDTYDIELKTEWIEEVWIGIRLGSSGIGLYLEPESCAVQRYDKHRNRPKLPVGGKKGILQGIAQNPIPARMIPYNIIDRLITLNIERSIAKYRDSITLIPQSLINTDTSGTYKEKMFYIKADGLLIYNDKTIDLNTINQGFVVKSNSGLENYFKILIEIRDKYRQECLEIANMNPERMGAIDPNAGKANTEQNIYRAKIGSLLGITMFNQALERDHNADLEFSKVAYISGKVGTFFDKSTDSNILVEVNPQLHLDSDYGVFVRNTKIDENKMAEYKNYAFNASQNGEFELAAAGIEADTVPEIRRAVKEINIARRDLEKSMNNQKNDAIRYAADQQKIISDDTIAAADRRAQLVSNTAIRVAEIGQGNNNNDNNLDLDKLTASNERVTDKMIEQRQHDDKMALQARGLDLKQEELGIKRTQAKKNNTK